MKIPFIYMSVNVHNKEIGEFTMKTQGLNKKRVIAFILSFLLIMQQSLAYQALASTITDASGNTINPNPDSGHFEIRPDAFNSDKNVGFSSFQDLNLSKNDVLNFIFQAWTNGKWTDSSGAVHEAGSYDIDTFVALVQNQINIDGIVNALSSVNGDLKTDGNMVFVSPNGMVVGASGVLNVGSLSVYTPTQDTFNIVKSGLPTSSDLNSQNIAIGTYTDKTFDPSVLTIDSNQSVDINGRVRTFGDINIQSGTVTVTHDTGTESHKTGLLIAGAGGDTTVLTNESAADALFNSLVNTDNMDMSIANNQFATSNGNIIITSSKGTSISNGASVKNFGSGDITITNTGINGVNIAGEVSNPNGNLTVTNSSGELLVDTTGIVKNKGAMTFLNNGTGTGLKLNGNITNEGTLTATNETGADGLLIAGTVTNTGDTSIKNKKEGVNGKGSLQITGSLNNTNALSIVNNGDGGMLVSVLLIILPEQQML